MSPWMANDGAKLIETWSWTANRMIASDCASDCASVSLDEIWTEKAFSALILEGTADNAEGCRCEKVGS